MGDQKEEERKVPVFTVFKKSSILKNIFLDAPQTTQPTANQEDEEEQVIVIGRHPDCSITLDHPSISRFHLRLHSNPSSLKLSLVDLSSVHGTWVSGKKVEPGVQVDLNEGDIVQLGGSSRRYILHWVPVSRAYNLDIPFVPPMDVLMSVKETEELLNQEENCFPSIETYQIQSQSTSMGELDLSISKKEITVSTLSPAMPEFGDSSCNNAEAKKGYLSEEEQKQNEISGISSGQPLKKELFEEIKNQHSGEVKENLPNASSPINDHNDYLFREEHKENEVSGFSSGTPYNNSAVTKFENQQCDEEHQENEISGIFSETPLKESAVTKCENRQSEEENDEDYEENERSGFSSGTPLKKSAVTQFETQQSDEENDEHPQALAEILSAKSPSGDYNKISAFSSGQLLNDSVLGIVNQQYGEEHENLQSLDGAISGIANGNSLNQQFGEEHENSQALDGAISGIVNVNSPIIDHNDHPLKEEHQTSDFSSGQLFNGSVLEIGNQQYNEVCENSQSSDGVLSGIEDANSSSTIYHNEHPLRGESEEDEISAFSSGQYLNESVIEITSLQSDGKDEESSLNGVLSGIANENSSPNINNYEHRLLREEFDEHETSAFSREQLFNESVLEIGNQQYNEVCENAQSSDGVISGIEDANSSSTIYHNEHPLRGESEENEISAFWSGQYLNESVIEITSLQSDGKDEESSLNGVLSGIANENSSPNINNYEHRLLREEFDEHETSAFSRGQLFNESVLEIDRQQYHIACEKSQALDGVPSGVEDADSSLTIFHNEHLLRGEFEDSEISASSSGQLLDDSVLETKYLHCDGVDEKPPALDGDLSGIADANSIPTIYHNEHQLKEEFPENEISTFMSVQLLDESVEEIGIQQYDEDHEKSKALYGVPNSLCQSYHNENLPEFFTSSFSDEDVEIICASRMENEQEKMSTSGWYSPCSSTVLERKDQLYLYEQDHSAQYYLSSGVHAESSKNTPNRSEQESNWPEIIRHSLSDVHAVVGEGSEALDDESSLKGDNKQKEVTVVTGIPKLDLMNSSVCCESIHTEVCSEQLDEKNNTGITFATNVSEPKDTYVNTPLSSEGQFGESFPTNTEVKELHKENLDYESVSEEFISNIEVFAEEIFTPVKKNFTPNTPKQRSTKKTDKLEDFKLLDPLCLSSPTKNSICQNFVQNEELTFSSDKENHTPKVLQKSRLVQPVFRNSATLNVELATKNRMSRIPLKSLLSNSSGKSCSNDTTCKSSNSGKYAQLIEKNAVAGENKRWIMVADTDCLLNKVSRKALQLLQGVKGTQLIIPRVVIRELDCMKRRGYLFTKAREISSALQWIEDCMKYTNWWINVESLMEEGRHFTPAISLSTSEGEMEDLAFSSASFSACLSFLEIVSPTPADCILECALLNRRIKNGENIVILSDDVSLKIKAMAEGIICETAEEFRDSLVNPFSDRFLWSKSSPRGLTWSCIDDIVLREKYYPGPYKKPPSNSGESLQGLKLILVQNSHFSRLIPN